jgi:hypothetical protein
MTPSSQQTRRSTSRLKIEENLGLLRRRGLEDSRPDELNSLLVLAHTLSNKPSDAACIEDALGQAIDACWGGSLGEGPSLRDVMRLWFGLLAVDDLEAPITREMPSPVRTTAAWEYWGGEAKEAKSTFRTSAGKRRCKALAHKLVELEAQAIDKVTTATATNSPAPEPSTSTAEPSGSPLPPQTQEQPADEPGVVTPPRVATAPDSRAPESTVRRSRNHWGTFATFAGIAVVVGLIVWAPWSTGSADAIPPLGAIVNAQTGTWTTRAAVIPVEAPVGVEEGHAEFRGCDVSTERPCRFSSPVPPLKPRVGDLLEFSVRLNNGYSKAIPYVKLEAHAEEVSAEKRPSPNEASHTREHTELAVAMHVSWPTAGDLGSGPTTTRQAHINQILIQFSDGAHYGLSYIPGSSEIYYRERNFLHHLPDGIFTNHFAGPGIALQDLGQPSTCYPCAIDYIRYVRFRVRVVHS